MGAYSFICSHLLFYNIYIMAIDNKKKTKKEQQEAAEDTAQSTVDNATPERNKEKELGTTYSYDDSEYNYDDLRNEIYDHWGNYVYNVNFGDYTDDQVAQAVSDMIDEMAYGNIAWNPKRNNFSVSGNALNLQQKNQKFQNGKYGSYTPYNMAASIISRGMENLAGLGYDNEKDEDDDSDNNGEGKIEWEDNVFGNLFFDRLGFRDDISSWYSLDNEGEVTNRTGKIRETLQSLRDDLENDTFSGIGKKQKQNLISQIDNIINNDLSDNILSSNEWYNLNRLVGSPFKADGKSRYTWSDIMKTSGFDQKEGESDEDYQQRIENENMTNAFNEYIRQNYQYNSDYNGLYTMNLNLDQSVNEKGLKRFLESTKILGDEQKQKIFKAAYEDNQLLLNQFGIDQKTALQAMACLYNVDKKQKFTLPFTIGNNAFYYDQNNKTLTKDWMFRKGTEYGNYWGNKILKEFTDGYSSGSTSGEYNPYEIFG